MLIHAHHVDSGTAIALTIENGRIAAIGPPTSVQPDLVADWIAPSFFDIQINGGLGISFNSPNLTIDAINQVAELVRAHGVGGFCPTLITTDSESFTHGFATLARACDEDAGLNRLMPAFHLEGPFIAADDGPRGAHPRRHVRPPDWQEFERWQDAAGGRIRLVTLAPELPGALPMIERLAKANVVVAIGHTASAPEQIRTAIAAGARISTHLGNGAHAVLPRHPNYIWEQLAADELWASFIADGHHLSDGVLKCMLRAKTPARSVLISDASAFAGLPSGLYSHGPDSFDVLSDGRVVVAGSQLLAGATVFVDRCVGHVLNRGLATLPEAIAMASIRPRELLGLPAPRLEVGESADMVLFDWKPVRELHIKCIQPRLVCHPERSEGSARTPTDSSLRSE
jgi:N-acetylglucosamine-6-phosphate deacetylase